MDRNKSTRFQRYDKQSPTVYMLIKFKTCSFAHVGCSFTILYASNSTVESTARKWERNICVRYIAWTCWYTVHKNVKLWLWRSYLNSHCMLYVRVAVTAISEKSSIICLYVAYSSYVSKATATVPTTSGAEFWPSTSVSSYIWCLLTVMSTTCPFSPRDNIPDGLLSASTTRAWSLTQSLRWIETNPSSKPLP